MVARLVRDEEAAGSSPAIPTDDPPFGAGLRLYRPIRFQAPRALGQDVAMYVPAVFAEQDESKISELIRRAPLAELVVHDGTELRATAVPLLFDSATNRLIGHLARPNDVGKAAASGTVIGIACLAIFRGADGYISPSAYPSKREHGKVVPTWNYETVHVHGRLVVRDDREFTLNIVERLTNHFESTREVPWSVSDAPADYIEGMLKAIVGIEVLIERVEAKRKLSQNRPIDDQAGVRDDLASRGLGAQALLDQMNNLVKETT